MRTLAVLFVLCLALQPCKAGDMGLLAEAPDYFTEYFDTYPYFDLDGMSLTFTPDGSPDFYSADLKPITALPVDPTSHNTIILSDDDYENIRFSGASTVELYGVLYGGINIGSNGFFTFDEFDGTYLPSTTNHFDQPRISTFFADLNPADGGRISWKELGDRVVVTFFEIRRYSGTSGDGGQCTFQCEMFFNGDIRMSWLGINYAFPLVGLSRGGGVPSDYVETDLSGFGWDYDGDGIPNTWEVQYFGGSTSCSANTDADQDGFSNLDEYISGTHPLDDSSYFHITNQSLELDGGAAYVLRWNAVDGRTYSIWSSSDLIYDGFTILTPNIGYPRNSCTVTVDQAQGARFYKVDVELSE